MNIKISNLTLSDIDSMSDNFSNNFDRFWSINILKDDFKNENSKYIVAKINDEIVGFAGIMVIGAIEQADIMNIAVRTDKRKNGIGSILLENLIELSKKLNCKTITLEVNERNLPAIHLYEKYNFKRIGLRKKYYNNTDDAIIMSLS